MRRYLMGLVLTLGLTGTVLPATALERVWEPSAPMMDLAQRVLQQSDHGNRAFAIVDKRAAVIAVYGRDGALAGVSTILLGLTPGDHTVPGVGQRTQLQQLLPQDLTTPAGRFVSQPGRNLTGEPVVWIDYGAALAIHRLRAGPAHRDRARRMASGDPRDKRISSGCVVVPEAFYEAVIQPLLGLDKAVVYVMSDAAGAAADGLGFPARPATAGPSTSDAEGASVSPVPD